MSAVLTSKALCPWCRRLVTVMEISGYRFYSTHGPGTDRLFCRGGGEVVR